MQQQKKNIPQDFFSDDMMLNMQDLQWVDKTGLPYQQDHRRSLSWIPQDIDDGDFDNKYCDYDNSGSVLSVSFTTIQINSRNFETLVKQKYRIIGTLKMFNCFDLIILHVMSCMFYVCSCYIVLYCVC